MPVLRPDSVRIGWIGTDDGDEREFAGQHIGWVAYVPFALGRVQLKRLVDFTVAKHKARYASLPEGPIKEGFARALKLLEQGRVRQVPMNEDQREHYDATRPHDDRKIISLPS